LDSSRMVHHLDMLSCYIDIVDSDKMRSGSGAKAALT